jgi:hypothetical protein
MPLVIAALLGICAAAFVLYPLAGSGAQSASRASSEYADITGRERAAKDALRELDFDYRLGNLEGADYHALRQRYEERALAALRTRYTAEQELDAQIDRELAALRTRESQGQHRNGKSAQSSSQTSGVKRVGGAARRRRGAGGGSRD